jgi:hypothetical protein
MRFFLAVTDGDWFSYLSAGVPPDEVNFWQPSGNVQFKALQPGETFLFKLHSPNDYIVGGGFFGHFSILPVSLAWEAFGHNNGARTIQEMRERVEHYRESVPNHAARGGLLLPAGREGEFAEWVYADPNRCPGLRLQHQTYRELMANYGDVPEAADFSDLAHVCAVPYVDVATLDRRRHDYCCRASRSLARLAASVNYDDRLAHNIADIQRRYP